MCGCSCAQTRARRAGLTIGWLAAWLSGQYVGRCKGWMGCWDVGWPQQVFTTLGPVAEQATERVHMA
eukprot:3242193-Alexandrium_andersonii.AAC.1